MKWEVAEAALKGFFCPVAFIPIISSPLVTDYCAIPFVCFFSWLVVVELVFLLVFWYQKRHHPFDLQVILHSTFLGFVSAVGFRLLYESLTNQGPEHFPLLSISIFIMVLCMFHFGEFLATAMFNSNTLTTDSFLLNHSLNYHLALFLAVIEFLLEFYLFPIKYQLWYLIPIGTGLCFIGEFIRKSAMATAGENFSHVIVQEHHEEHVLITHGIYRFWRHPSYLGWFLWSIGTQLLLINPICTIGYAVASWRFFAQRIWEEERTLVRFFGERYVDYKKRVGSGIPFVAGY